MPVVRKSHDQIVAEIEALIQAGREDEAPGAKSVCRRIMELAPGDWRVVMIFDDAIEVVCNRSFSSREEVVKAIEDEQGEYADWGDPTRMTQ